MKKSGIEQIKKEDVKQAVIVDYKALGSNCPGDGLSQKPLIQYTLEWLLFEKFDEIFICCLPDNAQQLRDFVTRFMRVEIVSSSMSIQVHSSEKNKSTGDCLRDLDAKALIKTDFVIMDVGCCGNLNLTELLEMHKHLKKSDKSTFLTSIVRNVFTKDPAEIGEFPIYITDPENGLLLHYEAGRVSDNEGLNPPARVQASRTLNVPSSIFLERSQVKIHTNLCSTNLSIYSVGVLAKFASSDFSDVNSEAELIKAVFDDQEILGGTVYIRIVDDLFSQRMADLGFVINQKWDKFDTNLIYRRNERSQVLRKLVNDSLIDCTRLISDHYLANLDEGEDDELESESELDESIMDDDEVFLAVVLDNLVSGFEESVEYENLIVEVNSSKHAYNINIDDVNAIIGRALLLLPTKLTRGKPGNSKDYLALVEKAIDRFKFFLLNYFKHEGSRKILLDSIEELCHTEHIPYLNGVSLAKVIYKLYMIDALDEESILDWYYKYEDIEAKKQLRALPAFKKLVEMLEDEDSDE